MTRKTAPGPVRISSIEPPCASFFLMQVTGRIKWSEIFEKHQTLPQTMSILGGGK